MLSQRTKNFIYAALSYREDKVQELVYRLLGLKSHWKAGHRGNSFYGVVLDPKNSILTIVTRGTDGFDWVGNLQSWWRNARILTGSDGVHNGFQDLGNEIIEFAKPYLTKFKLIELTGHSQGTGPSQYMLKLIGDFITKKQINNIVHAHADIFAYAPCGDERFKAIIDRYKDLGLVSCDGWLTEGDPIGSDVLRNEKTILLDGVDICKKHVLPVIVKYDLSVANVVKHSTKVYNAGMVFQCLREGKLIDAEYLASIVHEEIHN